MKEPVVFYIQYILPTLVRFLKKEFSINSSVSLEKITEQIFNLFIKILLAILLTVIMFAAFLSSLMQLNILILSFENGTRWLIFVNMIIFITGLLFLRYLSKSKIISTDQKVVDKINNSEINTEQAIVNFVEGFLEGLNKSKNIPK